MFSFDSMLHLFFKLTSLLNKSPGRGEGTAVSIGTSVPGRFHDGSQNSRSWTGLAPTAVQIRTSEPPRRLEPFHRLGRVRSKGWQTSRVLAPRAEFTFGRVSVFWTRQVYFTWPLLHFGLEEQNNQSLQHLRHTSAGKEPPELRRPPGRLRDGRPGVRRPQRRAPRAGSNLFTALRRGFEARRISAPRSSVPRSLETRSHVGFPLFLAISPLVYEGFSMILFSLESKPRGPRPLCLKSGRVQAQSLWASIGLSRLVLRFIIRLLTLTTYLALIHTLYITMLTVQTND